MSGICFRVSVMTGLLLITSQVFATDRRENVIVDLGDVSLPVAQDGNNNVYFAQTNKELPPVACISCGDNVRTTTTWKALMTYKEGSRDKGFLFDPGISGVLLRIQPDMTQAMPGSTGSLVTFGLVRADNLPANAGTFVLPGPVLERTVTEADGTGRVLNTTTTTFTVEGKVIVPTCQFTRSQAEITMPSSVSEQQLQSAGMGVPVKAVGAGETDLELQCATQTTGSFSLSFTANKTASGGKLLSGNKSGAGFLVGVVSPAGNETPVIWNSTPVSVTSMAGAGAKIRLRAWYSWDGEEITPGDVTANGLVTLKYQ